jgi:hypothetical protein
MLDNGYKNTHSEYVVLIAFPRQKNGYANAPQCYVIRTLPVLLRLKSKPTEYESPNGKRKRLGGMNYGAQSTCILVLAIFQEPLQRQANKTFDGRCVSPRNVQHNCNKSKQLVTSFLFQQDGHLNACTGLKILFAASPYTFLRFTLSPFFIHELSIL